MSVSDNITAAIINATTYKALINKHKGKLHTKNPQTNQLYSLQGEEYDVR